MCKPQTSVSSTQSRKARKTYIAEFIVCPACQSLTVKRKRSKKSIAIWQCMSCPHKWKEPADVGTTAHCYGKLAQALRVVATGLICYLVSLLPPTVF